MIIVKCGVCTREKITRIYNRLLRMGFIFNESGWIYHVVVGVERADDQPCFIYFYDNKVYEATRAEEITGQTISATYDMERDRYEI